MRPPRKRSMPIPSKRRISGKRTECWSPTDPNGTCSLPYPDYGNRIPLHVRIKNRKFIVSRKISAFPNGRSPSMRFGPLSGETALFAPDNRKHPVDDPAAAPSRCGGSDRRGIERQRFVQDKKRPDTDNFPPCKTGESHPSDPATGIRPTISSQRQGTVCHRTDAATAVSATCLPNFRNASVKYHVFLRGPDTRTKRDSAGKWKERKRPPDIESKFLSPESLAARISFPIFGATKAICSVRTRKSDWLSAFRHFFVP